MNGGSKLGLRRFLDAVACADDVARGKPDPAVFLRCAERIGLSPARCVVIGDAYAGIEAARAAGMRCVAVATTNPFEELRARSRADLVVRGMEEVTGTALSALLGRGPG